MYCSSLVTLNSDSPTLAIRATVAKAAAGASASLSQAGDTHSEHALPYHDTQRFWLHSESFSACFGVGSGLFDKKVRGRHPCSSQTLCWKWTALTAWCPIQVALVVTSTGLVLSAACPSITSGASCQSTEVGSTASCTAWQRFQLTHFLWPLAPLALLPACFL